MRRNKIKIIGNIVYTLGVAIVIMLCMGALFGSEEVNYDSGDMLPMHQKETSFIALAVGTAPMLLASDAVYTFNNIRTSRHKKRNFILIFLPGFICLACGLFIVAMFIIGSINTSVFRGILQ